jgi:phosphoglycerate dehydrogenase-like enzyme
VIYRPVDETGATERELAAAGCDVVGSGVDLPGVELTEQIKRADALMGATFRGGIMDAAFLGAFPNLRLVSKYTIGYDDVDVDAATGLGIAVTHCPTEANWGGVAEGAVAMILALLKRLRERDQHVKAGGWRTEALRGTYVGARGDGYPGITIGIVGLGRAGSRVAELLRPWRARLVAADPYVDDSRFVELGVQRMDFDRLLRVSDVVTVHCSLTRETRNLIDRRALESVKPGAVVINTARGAVVDLPALVAALESGRVASAALDVFPEEPLPAEARVRALGDRVLLSPHMVAANAGGTLVAAVPWALEATLDALRGQLPERLVNPEVAEAWRVRFGRAPLIARRVDESVKASAEDHR